MTKEDWLNQYHQKYRNGFLSTDEICTDEESVGDYPEYEPQTTTTAPSTAPMEEEKDLSPSTSRHHRQPDDLLIQDSIPTPRSQPDTADRFIAPQPIPSTSRSSLTEVIHPLTTYKVKTTLGREWVELEEYHRIKLLVYEANGTDLSHRTEIRNPQVNGPGQILYLICPIVPDNMSKQPAS